MQFRTTPLEKTPAPHGRWSPLRLLGNASGIFVLLWIAAGTPVARGEEPAQAFLAALREKHHFDLALTYLDQMQSSPIASESFRRRIPLYRAETIIESVNQLRDIEQWESRLNEAQQLLVTFSETATAAEDRSFAAETLANLRFRQARVYLSRSESPRLTDAERSAALDLVRETLQSCLASFETARTLTRTRLEEIAEIGKTATVDPEAVKQLRNSYTQIRLRKPIATEFLADTWPAGSSEQTGLLVQAEAEYQEVWKNYRNYAAGVDACLFAARCRQKLGKYADAILLLDELLTMNDQPALVPIKRRAGLMAIQSWQKMEPYPFEQVIQRLQPLLANLTRSQLREPDWLTIQLEVARGLRAKADSLVASGGSASEVRELNRTAGILAKAVARVPGSDQASARELLNLWKIEMTDQTDTVAEAPETFADAKALAADLVSELDLQRSELKTLQDQLAVADAARKPELESRIAEKTTARAATAQQALDLLRSAIRMATPDVSRADINHTRYLQAFVYFASGKFHEAALIGEFLMLHWPAEQWTQQSAALVINAWASIYEAAPPDDRAFELAKLMEVSQRVVERWNGSPEAAHAAGILARLALASSDIEQARKWSSAMHGSSSRVDINLRLAQQIWNDVQNSRNQPGAAGDEKTKADLERKIAEARKLLEEGLAESDPAAISFDVARGSLLLSRLLIDSGQPALAVDQLERTGLGALDLIKQNHPSVTGGSNAEAFQRETFRTAMSAYLGCLRNGGDPAQWIGKAEGVLAALRKLLASLPAAEASQELATFYSAIARELKTQIQSLSDPAERIRLAENLGVFLQSLGETTPDGRTILWAASTLIEVASSLEPGSAPDDPHLVGLYRIAVKLLDLARAKGFEGDPQAEALTLESGRYLGLAQRGVGNWEAATKAFADVLELRPSLLKTQMDAAETLQLQSLRTQQPRYAGFAMMGTEKRTDPKTKRAENVIWGWRRLVLATKGQADFADVYHRSLFALIECRLEFGILEKSDRAIQAALTELENWRRADPTFGGPEWKQKAEALEARIRQKLG